MQAIILAAGVGSRLQPLTNDLPKCLLQVNGRTLLERHIVHLKERSLSPVTIVTGHFHEKIHSFIQERFRNDSIGLCFNSSYQSTNNAYSLGLALEKRRDPFILLDGDLLFESSLLDSLISTGDENIFMVDPNRHQSTDEAMKVSLGPEGNIAHISKKISKDKALGEYIGMARLGKNWTENLLKKLNDLSDQEKNESYYEDIINSLIPSLPPIKARETENNFWIEIDTLDDLKKAEILWKDS